MKRRDFIKDASLLACGISLPFASTSIFSSCTRKNSFDISLAEWSLHRALFSNEIDHLDFISLARTEFEINAVEYVNTFFFNKAKDQKYLNEMKAISTDNGVKNLLIMCDNEGDLGDPQKKIRNQAVENHFKWADAAKYLGCHSIRVNARSDKNLSSEEQLNLAADGLIKLADYCSQLKINTIVENHGGLSSNGKWLSDLMKKVDHPNVGTLPDFGNFLFEKDNWYDRYLGVEQLMPHAKAVSAKSHEFNSKGEEIRTDFKKMMQIVLESGYNGYVGIEYEGDKHSEFEGIRLTRDLLRSIRNT